VRGSDDPSYGLALMFLRFASRGRTTGSTPDNLPRFFYGVWTVGF